MTAEAALADCDTLVIASRFAPVHGGHFRLLETALAANRPVLLLALGAGDARSLASPWTAVQRRAQLTQLLAGSSAEICMLRDIPYDHPRWTRRLAAAVPADGRIGLLADPRLQVPWPPEWRRIAVSEALETDAAAVRDALFAPAGPDWTCIERLLAPLPSTTLRRWSDGDDHAALREEAAFLREFRAGWAGAPYPPVFVTVDALVTCAGHVLLIRRARAPGRGLWALPGGFVDVHETLADAALRELAEETGLALTAAALGEQRVFDQPQRSLRGRTITHVFRIDLGDAAMPGVTAADDAAAARWVPLAALDAETMFEDHYAILQAMLKLI